MKNPKVKNQDLGRLAPDAYKSTVKIPLTIVLDNVRSLHNIGSVFRTCDAYLVERVILCGISTCPPHRGIHKSALGAEEWVPWSYQQHTLDAVSALQAEGYRVYALEQTERSVELDDFCLQGAGKMALVLGHEVRGVNQQVVDACDGAIELAQYGVKHSLNVSVSAGILICKLHSLLSK